jgi:hypothetical protein
MNREQQQIIDEVYENYWNSHPDAEKTFQYEGHNIETRRMTKDEFIDMVKTDKEYARRWGLKIEERELSLEERCHLGYNYVDGFEWDMLMGGGKEGDEGNCNDYKIPTKLITITRELSLDERVEYHCSQNWVLEHLKDSLRKQTPEQKTSFLSVANIPTNKTIESYE